MKNMDVGELRPRQVNDDEDDQVQVLSNSNLYYSIKSVQAAEFRLSHISLFPAQSTCDGFCDEQ